MRPWKQNDQRIIFILCFVQITVAIDGKSYKSCSDTLTLLLWAAFSSLLSICGIELHIRVLIFFVFTIAFHILGRRSVIGDGNRGWVVEEKCGSQLMRRGIHTLLHKAQAHGRTSESDRAYTKAGAWLVRSGKMLWPIERLPRLDLLSFRHLISCTRSCFTRSVFTPIRIQSHNFTSRQLRALRRRLRPQQRPRRLPRRCCPSLSFRHRRRLPLK